MFIGGSAGSTSGGFKIVRHLLLIKNGFLEFKRILHPNAIVPVRYNNKSVPNEIVYNILGFFIIYIKPNSANLNAFGSRYILFGYHGFNILFSPSKSILPKIKLFIIATRSERERFNLSKATVDPETRFSVLKGFSTVSQEKIMTKSIANKNNCLLIMILI